MPSLLYFCPELLKGSQDSIFEACRASDEGIFIFLTVEYYPTIVSKKSIGFFHLSFMIALFFGWSKLGFES